MRYNLPAMVEVKRHSLLELIPGKMYAPIDVHSITVYKDKKADKYCASIYYNQFFFFVGVEKIGYTEYRAEVIFGEMKGYIFISAVLKPFAAMQDLEKYLCLFEVNDGNP